MGMSKSSSLDLIFKWGVEGSSVYSSKRIPISGLVQSPWAYMIGNGSTSYTQAPSTSTVTTNSSSPLANRNNGVTVAMNASTTPTSETKTFNNAAENISAD